MHNRFVIFTLFLSVSLVSLPNPGTSDSGQGTQGPNKSPFEMLELEGNSVKGYEVFGFTQMPSEDVFARTVRSLKFRYHPDKDRSPEAEEVFNFVSAAAENPRADFYRNEKLNVQHYRAEQEFSLASLGIEQEDVARTLRVIAAGALICMLWEVRNVVVKKRQRAQQNTPTESN